MPKKTLEEYELFVHLLLEDRGYASASNITSALWSEYEWGGLTSAEMTQRTAQVISSMQTKHMISYSRMHGGWHLVEHD